MQPIVERYNPATREISYIVLRSRRCLNGGRVSTIGDSQIRSDRGVLLRAWGDFVSQFPWDWFCAFSFRGMVDRRSGKLIDVPPGTAHNLFSAFGRDIEKVAGHPIVWFRADEYGPRGGRLHIHALLSGVAHLRRLSWMDEWSRRAGWARIFQFNPAKGGARYASKYVVKQQGDWELSGLPAVPVLTQATICQLDGVVSRMPIEEWPTLHHPGVPLSGTFPRRDWESEMLRTGERWQSPPKEQGGR